MFGLSCSLFWFQQDYIQLFHQLNDNLMGMHGGRQCCRSDICSKSLQESDKSMGTWQWGVGEVVLQVKTHLTNFDIWRITGWRRKRGKEAYFWWVKWNVIKLEVKNETWCWFDNTWEMQKCLKQTFLWLNSDFFCRFFFPGCEICFSLCLILKLLRCFFLLLCLHLQIQTGPQNQKLLLQYLWNLHTLLSCLGFFFAKRHCIVSQTDPFFHAPCHTHTHTHAKWTQQTTCWAVTRHKRKRESRLCVWFSLQDEVMESILSVRAHQSKAHLPDAAAAAASSSSTLSFPLGCVTGGCKVRQIWPPSFLPARVLRCPPRAGVTTISPCCIPICCRQRDYERSGWWVTG